MNRCQNNSEPKRKLLSRSLSIYSRIENILWLGRRRPLVEKKGTRVRSTSWLPGTAKMLAFKERPNRIQHWSNNKLREFHILGGKTFVRKIASEEDKVRNISECGASLYEIAYFTEQFPLAVTIHADVKSERCSHRTVSLIAFTPRTFIAISRSVHTLNAAARRCCRGYSPIECDGLTTGHHNYATTAATPSAGELFDQRPDNLLPSWRGDDIVFQKHRQTRWAFSHRRGAMASASRTHATGAAKWKGELRHWKQITRENGETKTDLSH